MGLQYQDFLLEEFRSRRSRNPNYSLRAFARDLGMPASKLSQNLRGLCGISVAKAEVIAERIQLRDDDRRLFLALVESQHARSRVARQQAATALEKIRRDKMDELSVEKFTIVRDWYHMAILEMADIKGFRAEPAWIGSRLDLPVELVKEAIARLVEVGLLREEEGRLVQTQRDLELPSGLPSRSVREHHKQILTKAMVAADEVPVEEREFSSHTFAIAKSALPEMKGLIREFQRQVARLSAQGEKDDVYVLGIQLFSVLEKEP
jgi:uncharacterized protein (TIGR02147 family)